MLYQFHHYLLADSISIFYNIGIWLPWVATKGQYITSGEEFDKSAADNLQNCMTRCLRDPNGGRECRAITISTSADKTCELRTVKVGDEAVDSESSLLWQSFSRPAWYLGKYNKILVFMLVTERLRNAGGKISFLCLSNLPGPSLKTKVSNILECWRRVKKRSFFTLDLSRDTSPTHSSGIQCRFASKSCSMN